MRILELVSLTAMALEAVAIQPLPAQTGPQDSGWGRIHIAVGPGWSKLGTPVEEASEPGLLPKIEEESRFLGLGASFGFGSHIDDNLTIGVEVSAWTGATDRPTWAKKRRVQLGLHGVVYFYPRSKRRLFLKGGIGVGMLVIDTINGGREANGTGLGYLVGIGYDIPVRNNAVLAPYLEMPFVRHFKGGTPNVIQMGISLTLAPEVGSKGVKKKRGDVPFR
jgi:hypothetical protein